MANITEAIRQKVEDSFFSSTRFAARFQQNLSGVYGFSQRRGTGIVVLTHPFLVDNNVKGVTKTYYKTCLFIINETPVSQFKKHFL